MDGVILFVDDKVHDCYIEGDELKRTPENQLFEALRKAHPVLGINNLDLAERAIKSIGSFSVIILDWIFDDREVLLGAGESDEDLKFVRPGSVKDTRTLDFLKKNDFYSLVYIYSNEEVEEKYGEQLKERFGDRIHFEKKNNLEPSAEAITQKIKDWTVSHQNLSIPLVWTATINQAIQQIFKELADADANWLREIGKSAQSDGVSGEIFIIEILQYLLAESLIQNSNLIASIKEHLSSESTHEQSNEESIAKLFRRLLFTKLSEDASIMTGDICEIDENKFGIIITPECDIGDVVKDCNLTFELLTFSKDSFDKFLQLEINDKYQRTSYANAKEKQLKKLRSIFNQNNSKYHVLPSFPFDDTTVNFSIVVDFSKGCERYTSEQIKEKRKYKLNSPFIQQLRQRYIAHLGRVGTPSLPSSLRDFNLK
jgi:hypothetical protein